MERTGSERLYSVQNLKCVLFFFFAKSLNMPFKDKIQDSTDLILIWNRHILRVLSTSLYRLILCRLPCIYLYQCFGRYELFDLYNQYVRMYSVKCYGVHYIMLFFVYILMYTKINKMFLRAN